MSTTFDEPESTPEWDNLIEAVNTVHVRRSPTVDDLLDLRSILREAQKDAEDDGEFLRSYGLETAVNYIDELLASL